MPRVQTKLDLPARKPGRSTPAKSTPGKSAKATTQVKSGKSTTVATKDDMPRTPGRSRPVLVAPTEDPETLMRTPRRERKSRSSTPCKPATDKAVEELRTPKRKGKPVSDIEAGVSPSKSAKKLDDLKENVQSPSVMLRRLDLNSPRQPLSARLDTNKSPAKEPTARTNLFSPRKKLDAREIEDLLCSPTKSVIKVDDDISFNSPSKPTAASRQVFRKPLDVASISPARSSPRKPVVTINNKDVSASPARSPRKPMTPVKACGDAAAPLVSGKSPRRSADADTAVKSVTQTRGKSPRKPATPNKNVASKKSPFKINSIDDLEALLCSPEKERVSPVKPVAKDPISLPATSGPARSPRKPATPMKSPRKGAANLFTSPERKTEAPVPAPAQAPASNSSLYKVDLSQLQAARAAMHTGAPGELLCRSEQVSVMSAWLDHHLLEQKPGSLYVSGAPGTGKTASLTHLLKSKKGKYKSIFINCMIVKSAVAVYKMIATELRKSSTVSTEKEALREIENTITSKGNMILLVLDEVDQLESKFQDVLYTIFEWPALSGSRLSLVGIANTLDLTDRVLPRLQVKEIHRPTLLHYPPYNKQQIAEIITKRLESSGVDKDVINPRAITFLAGKISALTGDIRKALDICRRAVEQVEMNARKQTLLKPVSSKTLCSPSKSPHKGYKNPKQLPKIGQVDLPHIMRVINQVYGGKLKTSLGMGNGSIPTQQKIMMASLLLLVKKGTGKEVTLGKLIQTFTKVCKKRGLQTSEEGECVAMMQGLESRGFVTYANKGAPMYAKISLRVDEKEVEQVLEDKVMLSSIINDVSCLP